MIGRKDDGPAPADGRPSPGESDVEEGLGFLAHVLVAILVLVSATLGSGVLVDPWDRFDHQVVPPLVVKDAQRKTTLLEDLDQPPEFLVLGTSRIAMLGQEDLAELGERRVFNYALNGGSPIDSLVAFRYVVQELGPPEVLVVGIDVPQVQPLESRDHPVTQVPELAPLVGAEAPPRPPLEERLWATFNPTHVEDTARATWYAFAPSEDRRLAYQGDGSRHRTDIQHAAQAGTFQAGDRVRSGLDLFADRLRESEPMTQESREAITTLVTAAHENRSSVRFVLTPLHPMLADEIETSQAYQETLENLRAFLDELCGPQVQVLDLHSIDRFGGRADRFYDGWHVFGENEPRMGEAIAEGRADRCDAGPPADEIVPASR